MKPNSRIKIPKNNSVAQAALGRKPTKHPHRNAPRGGAINEQAVIAETLFEEEEDADSVEEDWSANDDFREMEAMASFSASDLDIDEGQDDSDL